MIIDYEYSFADYVVMVGFQLLLLASVVGFVVGAVMALYRLTTRRKVSSKLVVLIIVSGLVVLGFIYYFRAVAGIIDYI